MIKKEISMKRYQNQNPLQRPPSAQIAWWKEEFIIRNEVKNGVEFGLICPLVLSLCPDENYKGERAEPKHLSSDCESR